MKRTLNPGYLLFDSVSINGKKINVRYNEIGTADYTVYLKDNNYYETDYLKSGMKYVASLIKTINTKFNYEVHSNQNVNYSYNPAQDPMLCIDGGTDYYVRFEK